MWLYDFVIRRLASDVSDKQISWLAAYHLVIKKKTTKQQNQPECCELNLFFESDSVRIFLFKLINTPALMFNILAYSQVRIQDLVKGGAPASAAESCRRSEAE